MSSVDAKARIIYYLNSELCVVMFMQHVPRKQNSENRFTNYEKRLLTLCY